MEDETQGSERRYRGNGKRNSIRRMTWWGNERRFEIGAGGMSDETRPLAVESRRPVGEWTTFYLFGTGLGGMGDETRGNERLNGGHGNCYTLKGKYFPVPTSRLPRSY